MSHRRRAVAIIGLGAMVLVLLFAAAQLLGLRINLTPSYPLGLWRIMPLERQVAADDLVFVCPPPTPEFEMARDRGYLSAGLCPGWMSPLLKTVVALPGQTIVIGELVTIDERVLPESVLRPVDAEGRKLSAFVGGVVPPHHAFLHSSFAGSYDSRYFGPIPLSGLLGRAHPVFTFGP
ncbi:conjugative transfer signal peptidase TraF [Aquamicrobium sp. NLF2-7]|uniref:conjugative transfer signal peptidase TraF n=1 Tax=Aquamicrobium sp. NLF2-7 TaxID=2918753 RepID=UPI0031F303AB